VTDLNGNIVLRVKDLEVRYGEIPAIRKISFEVQKGKILAILGANGAGKTTILKTIAGILKPAGGSITLVKGHVEQELGILPAHKVAYLGVALIPEARGLLTRMTVIENLQMGAFFVRKDQSEVNQDIERMLERFPALKERRKQAAGNLSGGEQQMLAVARGLMARPYLLLVDEPSLGLAPKLVMQTFQLIQEIRNTEGITILLVEQKAREALRIADNGCVLETGSLLFSDSATNLAQNEEVLKAYLA
jgi:branched-chain amino acid transport system ATP-binding protein